MPNFQHDDRAVTIDYGGLYLDNDVLVARTFDPLRRRYELTLDREGARLLANGIIVATPHSQFLRIWLEGYRDYKPNSWLANSLTFAHNLSVLASQTIVLYTCMIMV